MYQRFIPSRFLEQRWTGDLWLPGLCAGGFLRACSPGGGRTEGVRGALARFITFPRLRSVQRHVATCVKWRKN